MDLLSVATELYGGTPSDFTAARNSLAGEVSSRGERELAATIRKLPKQSAAAWAVNQLAAGKVRDEFSKLGAELRDAQSHADREALTNLLKRRRSLLAATQRSVEETSRNRGVALSQSAIREVEQTLQAALADEDGFAAAFSGRLIRSIQSDGLEPVDTSGAVGGPELPSKSNRSRTNQKKRAASSSTTARKSADEARVLAIQARKDADAALKDVENRLEALKGEREDLDHDAAGLQQKFDELEQRQRRLDESESALKRERRQARKVAEQAHRGATE